MRTTNFSKKAYQNDERWMRHALNIGERGRGRVAPNPSVGCVLVKSNIVVGRGWTQPGGRPHAETVALKQAGPAANGATAYVTLEPCAHFGVTPPCADALIKAGVSRVVLALADPDHRVDGSGIEKLLNAGVEVTSDILSKQAKVTHQGFLLRTTLNRPQFTLKLAISNDGKIAKANGDSKWITGSKARQFGHMMRAKHDAILVGVNTVLADDPMLTCRINGMEDRSPIRVILDTKLKTPVTSKLVQTANTIKTIIVTEKEDTNSIYTEHGVSIHVVPSTRDMQAVASSLALDNINSVLIEGGAQVAASFINADIIDICSVFKAPASIGADGIDAITGINLEQLLSEPRFILENTRKFEPDILATYRKAG